MDVTPCEQRRYINFQNIGHGDSLNIPIHKTSMCICATCTHYIYTNATHIALTKPSGMDNLSTSTTTYHETILIDKG